MLIEISQLLEPLTKLSPLLSERLQLPRSNEFIPKVTRMLEAAQTLHQLKETLVIFKKNAANELYGMTVFQQGHFRKITATLDKYINLLSRPK